MKTSHGVIQGYNGMAIADNKHQVICAAHATGNGQEHQLLPPLIDEATENMRRIGLGSSYFKGKKVIADTGLFSESNLKFLSKMNIDGYIPDQYYRKRDPRFKSKDAHLPKRKKLFSKEDFTYRKDKNEFTCPSGMTLRFTHRQTFGNTEGRVFSAKESECKKCIRRKDCLKAERSRKRTLYVTDKYFDGRNYSDAMKKKMDTPFGRYVYSRRMGIIEPVFGNIRGAKGLDAFSLRSESKVNIQWLMFSIVHNVGKIQRYGAMN